jgi:tartrate/fumarate subfamily iron-sulfur-dependent hydro-lyase alpha chain
MNEFPETLTPRSVAALVEGAIPALACDLREDYMIALNQAIETERGQLGRSALEQLVENAGIAARERVPICQDTGYVWVLLELGGSVCAPAGVFSEVDAAVARAYGALGLRKSMLRDALLDRTNTLDNSPAFCELKLTGSSERKAVLHIMLKGGGSDNASRVVMLPPGSGTAGVRETVLQAVREKAANACPPVVVGVGVGSSFDKVAGLAKHALLRRIGSPNRSPELQALEEEWLSDVNALGIGPGGFGGSTTALAVHIETAPCHIAALPMAVNIGCSAMRSVSIDLLARDGSPQPATGPQPAAGAQPAAGPQPAPGSTPKACTGQQAAHAPADGGGLLC